MTISKQIIQKIRGDVLVEALEEEIWRGLRKHLIDLAFAEATENDWPYTLLEFKDGRYERSIFNDLDQ